MPSFELRSARSCWKRSSRLARTDGSSASSGFKDPEQEMIAPGHAQIFICAVNL
jgi:hypothetical protein